MFRSGGVWRESGEKMTKISERTWTVASRRLDGG